MLSFESISDTSATNHSRGGWGATQVDVAQFELGNVWGWRWPKAWKKAATGDPCDWEWRLILGGRYCLCRARRSRLKAYFRCLRSQLHPQMISTRTRAALHPGGRGGRDALEAELDEAAGISQYARLIRAIKTGTLWHGIALNLKTTSFGRRENPVCLCARLPFCLCKIRSLFRPVVCWISPRREWC